MVQSSELMLVQLDTTGDQEALGRNRGNEDSCTRFGNPLKFMLTPGQRHDITQAETLTENVFNSVVVADKGYDSNTFIASLESKGLSFHKKRTKKCKGIMTNMFIKSDI